MSDLIKREDAIWWVKTECNPYGKPTLDFESGKKVIEHLKHMPSTDRPQGEWVLISEVASNLGHKCSNCGEKAKMIVVRSVLVDNYYCNKAEPITEYTHKEQLSKFCPNCGARMKGVDDE